jgi:drug/metabolite transporter (DMT)-like permease
VVALILGVTLNHEKVTGFEWLSVGVALIGVMLLLSDQGLRRDNPASTDPAK